VSPHVVAATLAMEDRRFRAHMGVDPIAVVRAAWQDAVSCRIVSGASTISMQVARMLEPRPRGVWAKIAEMFRALQLERRLSKDEILTLYLNLAPYGGNLYGIEAASLAYFGVHAKMLTLPEAALLAGIPQSPTRLRPDRFMERALVRRKGVLAAMVRDGVLEDAAPYLANDAPTSAREVRFPSGVWTQGTWNLVRKPLPFLAPHFANLVAAEFPRETVLRTTLDVRLQERVERQLRATVAALAGVTNGACVVLDNESSEVLAYAGSVDFWSVKDGGQVDGVRAFRSPGSTLKPLLYAHAYGKGLLAPEEQLADIPLGSLAWQPDNFDRTSHGLVQAQEALGKSYNLTAARLLRRVDAERFLKFIAEAGILERLRAVPGLALILGASEVRLIDLAMAYAALARGGVMRSPRFLAGASEDGGRTLFSPEACHLVSEALTGTPPGTPYLDGFAAKTGTSWGRRDAWTVAYTPRYTVGVWFGNFSGEASPALVGGVAARPCAIEILSWLDPRPSWPAPPPGIRPGRVCAETGLAAGECCPKAVEGRVLAVDRRTCAVHKRCALDASSNELLCDRCMAGREVTWQVIARWPPDIEAYLRARGKAAQPPHNPACPGVTEGALVIAAPTAGRRYAITDGTVAVKVFVEDKELFYFLDGAALQENRPEFQLPITAGRHVLACSDAEGRTAKVSFECVREPE
jgi:penicillin-binding protein 1C